MIDADVPYVYQIAQITMDVAATLGQAKVWSVIQYAHNPYGV